MTKRREEGSLGLVLPQWAARAACTPLGVVASSWLVQGFRYMAVMERLLKVAVEVTATAVLVCFGGPPSGWIEGIGMWALAHTANWLVDGQPWVALRYVVPIQRTVRRLEVYGTRVAERAARLSAVRRVLSLGSHSRGSLGPTSDVDLRIVVAPDLLSRLVGAVWCMGQRARATLVCFPLDIYCMTEDELAVRPTAEDHRVLVDKR